MKFYFVIASLLISNNTMAFNDDPSSNFDTSANYTSSSTITWIPVDNVQKSCEAESRRRGYKGFGYSMFACSFFDGNQCTIITGKKTNMHTLGHEVRHCFQGNWH